MAIPTDTGPDMAHLCALGRPEQPADRGGFDGRHDVDGDLGSRWFELWRRRSLDQSEEVPVPSALLALSAVLPPRRHAHADVRHEAVRTARLPEERLSHAHVSRSSPSAASVHPSAELLLVRAEADRPVRQADVTDLSPSGRRPAGSSPTADPTGVQAVATGSSSAADSSGLQAFAAGLLSSREATGIRVRAGLPQTHADDLAGTAGQGRLSDPSDSLSQTGDRLQARSTEVRPLSVRPSAPGLPPSPAVGLLRQGGPADRSSNDPRPRPALPTCARSPTDRQALRQVIVTLDINAV